MWWLMNPVNSGDAMLHCKKRPVFHSYPVHQGFDRAGRIALLPDRSGAWQQSLPRSAAGSPYPRDSPCCAVG